MVISGLPPLIIAESGASARVARSLTFLFQHFTTLKGSPLDPMAISGLPRTRMGATESGASAPVVHLPNSFSQHPTANQRGSPLDLMAISGLPRIRATRSG